MSARISDAFLLHFQLFSMVPSFISLQKKQWSFPLRISSVTLTLQKPLMENFIFVQCIFSFTISDPVHFEVNWVSVPSRVYMWASSIAVFQETRRVSRSQGSKILFFLNLFKKFISINSYFNVWLYSNYC